MIKIHAPFHQICNWLALAWLMLGVFDRSVSADVRVGVAKVDISPQQLPVLVNGSMRSRTADQITTRIHARALVIEDGRERIGLVVVDSCMLPRTLCDEAKQLAASQTSLRPDRIMISATHTHTAPSSQGGLGTDADPIYVPFIRHKLAEALAAAEADLQPCRIGWGSGMAPEFTALRRWVRRPDRLADDPFGNPTVRASMHAARNPDDVVGPSGPEDPELALIAFQTPDGQPLAVLANFSMHYFGGEQAISADYFGLFCDQLEQRLKQESPGANPLVIMSHGCSGDIWRRDYMRSATGAAEDNEPSINEYALGLVAVAAEAYRSAQYQSDSQLDMSQSELSMRYRVPDQQRLTWAQQVVDDMGDRLPESQPEIYAREQIFLHERQTTDIVTQAIRIGDIAIATTPNETYALTGLKLKQQSPARHTMVIELANGGDGYIPPPEQHPLGGYNTWAARSAGLEVTAEPRIVATALDMLEHLFARPRRAVRPDTGRFAEQIQALAPLAYWRLHEFSPPTALDASGHQRHGQYEPGVLFFLEGPDSESFCGTESVNRCPHFAGGRMKCLLPELSGEGTVVLSFWNGMPLKARSIAGWMCSRDHPYRTGRQGLHLGLDGSGRLALQCGLNDPMLGSELIERWHWARVALVFQGRRATVFLAGKDEPEIEVDDLPQAANLATWFFGGRSDGQDNWEGRLDEIAVFDRALKADEIRQVLEVRTD